MNKISNIIPAVLSENYSDINNLSFSVKDVANVVQIDICDGSISQTYTWPLIRQKSLDDSALEHGLPYWEDLDYEIDLLTNTPAKYLDFFVELGITRCVIHPVFVENFEFNDVCNKLATSDIELGIGLLANCSFDKVHEYLNVAVKQGCKPYFQVMGIKNIGMQGQGFFAEAISFIEGLRNLYPDITIQVDGAVSQENIILLKNAGANRFVVGSWIKRSGFSADKAMQKLNDLI